MAIKPHNKVLFYSPEYGYLVLVKKSIGLYHYTGIKVRGLNNYWRGQLAMDWQINSSTGDTISGRWFPKGTVVWIDAEKFKPMDKLKIKRQLTKVANTADWIAAKLDSPDLTADMCLKLNIDLDHCQTLLREVTAFIGHYSQTLPKKQISQEGDIETF